MEPVDDAYVECRETPIQTPTRNFYANPQKPSPYPNNSVVIKVEPDSDTSSHNVPSNSYLDLHYNLNNANPDHNANFDSTASVKVEPGLEDYDDNYADFAVPVLRCNSYPKPNNPSSYREHTSTVGVGVEREAGASAGNVFAVSASRIKIEPDGDEAEEKLTSSSAAAAATTAVRYSLRNRQVYVSHYTRRRR